MKHLAVALAAVSSLVLFAPAGEARPYGALRNGRSIHQEPLLRRWRWTAGGIVRNDP
jgi:hypothetical protein